MNLPAFLLIALLWFSTIVYAQPYECDPECTKLGNCNLETGECDCPYGRSGKKCEVDLLPACRLRPEAIAHCGPVALRPCECLLQCREYLQYKENVYDGRMAEDNRPCFHRTALGDKQIAKLPMPDEQGVEYYEGFLKRERVNYTVAMEVPRAIHTLFPLTMCPNECNGNGICYRWRDNENMAPTCQCYKGFEGSSCETEVNTCTNKCQGRGKCQDSFCHCEPGYWGIDCGRNKAYPSNSALPHPTDFKIYVYELPFYLANQVSYDVAWRGYDPNYAAFELWVDELLNSSVRTENPWEANMFYIAARTYHYPGFAGHIERVIEYVQQKFPFWNRTDGRDHMVWVSGDRHSCVLNDKQNSKPIKLTHFAYFDNNDGGKAKPVIQDVHPVWGCYHPLRDISMMPYEGRVGEWSHQTFRLRKLDDETPLPERKRLFFFSGSVTNSDNPEYSGGTRQELAKWVGKWNDKEMEFVTGYVESYRDMLMSSKFCLAPYGYGWGIRIVQIMATGCVPVIIQEHVFQPYEDILPYEDFSVRLNNKDIPNFPKILRSITDEEYKALAANVEKYYRAFIWDRQYGGQAFEYSILNLRRRHLNFKGLYYGRHDAGNF